MLMVLLVSLYTSRVVLNTLGIEDYGIYNTVAGFVSMFAFLNSTLSSSMQRFYSYEGAQSGCDGYRKVYSAGIIIHLFLIVVIFIVLESFGVWFLNRILVIPADRLVSANIIFQTSVMSMMILLLKIPFVGAILASEMMDYYAIVSVIDVILRFICVLFLPIVTYDKLIVYSLFLLLITIIEFLFYFIYAKRKILKYSIIWKLDKVYAKRILSFSVWNLLGTFAFLLKGQGVNMLLNVFFGPIINAARGVAYQVNGAITGFTSNISIAYRPQIVSSYSKENYERVENLFFSESKICFVLITIFIVPVIFNIDYILSLWLGDAVPEKTSIFTILVLIDSLICTLNTPVSQVVFASGNIKSYQIASSMVNFCLLPLSYLGLCLGQNASFVFFMTILISILNQIVCLYKMQRVFPISIVFYYKRVLLPCLAFVLLLVLSIFLLSLFISPSFSRLFLMCVASVIFGIVLMLYVVLNAVERKNIILKIKKTIKKYA